MAGGAERDMLWFGHNPQLSSGLRQQPARTRRFDVLEYLMGRPLLAEWMRHRTGGRPFGQDRRPVRADSARFFAALGLDASRPGHPPPGATTMLGIGERRTV